MTLFREINPNRAIDKDHGKSRPWRLSSRLPSHCTFPARCKNVFLFFEANEDPKSRLDHCTLGIKPSKAKGLCHKLVVDFDIGAHRILVGVQISQTIHIDCYDPEAGPQGRSSLIGFPSCSRTSRNTVQRASLAEKSIVACAGLVEGNARYVRAARRGKWRSYRRRAVVPLKATPRISGCWSSSRSIALGRSSRIVVSALLSRSPSSQTSHTAIRCADRRASRSAVIQRRGLPEQSENDRPEQVARVGVIFASAQ